jgi:phosphate transport system substrate-binding protein
VKKENLKEKKESMSRTKLVTLFAVLAVLVSACATPTAATSAPVIVEKTVQVEKTVVVEKVITATPGPVVAATATPTALPDGSVQINGAGATFPLPVYTEWTYAYQFIDASVIINYQGIGSGGGKKGIIDNTVDFAGSDSLLSDEEYASGKELQMYPMLAGAVVPVYNIEGVTDAITLSREVLVDIFNAKITKWSDPAIVALNSGIALPDAAITVVHRSDGSGTTEIFTKALASFSQEWKDSVGAGSAVEWPVDKAGNGIGGKGNQGVAAAVLTTKNSIGYVELSYAIANKMTFAKMVNKAGKVVTADAASTESAISDFANAFSDRLTATIVDGAGEGSWPIAGYTYLILHTQSTSDCVKAQKLLEYIHWTLTDEKAASRASQLGYSVLPEAVRDQVLAKLGEVTCSGQSVLK